MAQTMDTQSNPPAPQKGKTSKDSLRDTWDRGQRFARRFTEGLNRRELERLFDEDTSRAVSVLTGVTPRQMIHEDDPVRLLGQIKDFFVGLAFRLSPARRLLFSVCLLLPLASILDSDLNLGFSSVSFTFDPSVLWFLLSLSGLTLLLALELVDQLRVRDELEVARQLQSELLPQDDPHIGDCRLVHSYRTANEIGGDYYDFIPLEDGRWALTVGDASGHGIGAGLLMAIASAVLKTAVELDPSPPAVLDLINRTLCRTGGRRAFMTLFYGVLDPAEGTLEYACAGHPFPLLRHASGEVEELGEGALPLGLRRGVQYATGQTTLEPGTFLVLYSDGIPEAHGKDDRSFGFKRLHALVSRALTARSLHDEILADVDDHLGDRDLEDDLTLVILERSPPLPSG